MSDYILLDGYKGHRLSDKRGRLYLHHMMVEKAAPGLFKPEKGHEIHHTSGTLVVCESKAYHKLLHVREEALKACGDAHKRRCYICGEYDFVENLALGCRTYRHKKCSATQTKEYRKRRKQLFLQDK